MPKPYRNIVVLRASIDANLADIINNQYKNFGFKNRFEIIEFCINTGLDKLKENNPELFNSLVSEDKYKDTTIIKTANY